MVRKTVVRAAAAATVAVAVVPVVVVVVAVGRSTGYRYSAPTADVFSVSFFASLLPVTVCPVDVYRPIVRLIRCVRDTSSVPR